MKRAERHHLKENELRALVRDTADRLESRRSETMTILGIVAAIAVVGLVFFGWRERTQNRAHALLAEAQVVQDARVGPPGQPGMPEGGLRFNSERERAQAALTKFKVAADAHPTTDAGLYARYQQAATYMTLGNPAEAATTYQQVVDKAGDKIYGQMARLGLAESQAAQGQYDQAINTFKELAQRKEGPLPVDGILMQLGRVYLEAGKRADAQQTFNRLVTEFPESPFSAEARRELESLKKAPQAEKAS